MGGAYTALSGDPAACSFYNPATLARMEGTSLSAAVSVYNKYETHFGDKRDFAGAPLRVNQGSFTPIPTSSGSVYTFRNFALGLSILIPATQSFEGEVKSEQNNISLLRLEDRSLWVGGSFALNFSEALALGLTMYYTARNYSRSVTDRIESGGITSIANEEKIFTNNSLIYMLGLYQQLSRRWSLGLSHRFSSMEISGHGTYFYSDVSTAGTSSTRNEDRISSETRIPSKTTLGLAYEQKGHLTLSADLSYYGQEQYRDLDHPGGDWIRHKNIWNFHLGGEYYVKTWLSLRAGIFSNFSSSPEIPYGVSERRPDHIDMWGFSTNAAIYTSSASSLTLGGYWVGGQGHSTQLISGSIEKVPMSMQTFTLLVGTTFRL